MSDVARRLETHNSGGSIHTVANRPWQLVAAIEYSNVDSAVKFERYLKSGFRAGVRQTPLHMTRRVTALTTDSRGLGRVLLSNLYWTIVDRAPSDCYAFEVHLRAEPSPRKTHVARRGR